LRVGLLDAPDGFFPSGVLFKGVMMRIVVQDRKTNAFLTHDSRWVKQFDYARAFSTSLEALRFCASRNLTQMDLLICYPGERTNMRMPLC
jgi:hypothetical protein